MITANSVYFQAYTVDNIVKAMGKIGLGWLLYLFIFKRATLKLPRVLEEFEHLIGVMSVMLILLFWMAFSWLDT